MSDPNKEVEVLDHVAAGAEAAADAGHKAVAENPGKSIFKSKTFWFNMATFGASYLGYVPLPYAGIVVPLVNIALRAVTSVPVKLK